MYSAFHQVLETLTPHVSQSPMPHGRLCPGCLHVDVTADLCERCGKDAWWRAPEPGKPPLWEGCVHITAHRFPGCGYCGHQFPAPIAERPAVVIGTLTTPGFRSLRQRVEAICGLESEHVLRVEGPHHRTYGVNLAAFEALALSPSSQFAPRNLGGLWVDGRVEGALELALAADVLIRRLEFSEHRRRRVSIYLSGDPERELEPLLAGRFGRVHRDASADELRNVPDDD